MSRPEDRIDNLLRSGRGDPLSFIPITAAVRLAVECAGRFFDDWLEKAWASLSQSVELVTALAIGHPSTNHLKKWVDSPARCLITCSILS